MAEEILAKMLSLQEETSSQLNEQFLKAFLFSFHAIVYARQQRFNESLKASESAFEVFRKIEVSTLANEGLALAHSLEAVLILWKAKIDFKMRKEGKNHIGEVGFSCSEERLQSLAANGLTLLRRFGAMEHPFYLPMYKILSALNSRLLQLSRHFFPRNREQEDEEGIDEAEEEKEIPLVNNLSLHYLSQAALLADQFPVPYEQGLARLELVKLSTSMPNSTLTTLTTSEIFEINPALDVVNELTRAMDYFLLCGAQAELRECQELLRVLTAA